MSTLAVTHPTLFDLAKIMDPNGGIASVVEILNQTNEILDDAVWVEGNLPTGHKSTIRSGLPTPTWRKLYGGVQPTKGRTVQVTDSCGMLEAYAEVDKRLADIEASRLPGLQPMGLFLERRISPARATCAWAQRRQDAPLHLRGHQAGRRAAAEQLPRRRAACGLCRKHVGLDVLRHELPLQR